MIIRLSVIALIFLLTSSSFAQNTKSLPKELNELSGLAFVNDSILVAHNDGGDEPRLYFLSLSGRILHTCFVNNAKNVDWEDLAFDGKKYLYIGDFGNNENKRMDLRIYRVDLFQAMLLDKVPSSSFGFKYPDQKAFPPSEDQFYFDAEAMSFHNDSLYIFTKCRTKPWDGNAHVYSLSTEMKDQTPNYLSNLQMGSTGWWQDGITGSEIQGKYCFIMTYNRINVYKIRKGKLHYCKGISLKPITQKEGIAVNSRGLIVVGDERSTLLGGGELYFYKTKYKK
jgi:hypothetical protein